jgi:hypothetical protein
MNSDLLTKDCGAGQRYSGISGYLIWLSIHLCHFVCTRFAIDAAVGNIAGNSCCQVVAHLFSIGLILSCDTADTNKSVWQYRNGYEGGKDQRKWGEGSGKNLRSGCEPVISGLVSLINGPNLCYG